MKISLTLFVVVSLLLGSLPRTLAVNSQDNHFDRSSWPLILPNRDCKGDKDDDCN
ncbi:hypothetical protein [Microcystis sp. LE19-195.1E]|uniref:hypothetical protein n=1 Tax=Microcystis sp. LE19-195.1E TaxID=3016440 RepID=UPI0025870499|nr:hypothetical protein [Microcystis sp. LE19-195.1E]